MGSKQLLVRDVPEQIRSWIERERKQRRQTQKEFVINALQQVCEGKQPALPFEPVHVEPSLVQRIPFAFVDLFAGIGGYRIPLEKLGGKCVFSSEKDKYCQKTYRAWFGETPSDDITDIKPADIPDHDVLAAGFPCQPFSIAGVLKKKRLRHTHGLKSPA